jgi:membrane fusion protein, copper/silver efflux system
MKRITFKVVLVPAAAAMLAGGAWLNQLATARAETGDVRRALYYVDPMHPSYTSPRPGTAPDCGMALEPVYAGAPQARDVAAAAGAPPARVDATPDQQRLMGVQVAAVESASAPYTRRLFGRVTADETRVYQINVGVDGYVRQASAATTGSAVSSGQVLAIFSSPDVRQPVQSYLVALDVLDRAQKHAESPAQISLANAAVSQTADRLRTVGMSTGQIEDVRRTRLVPATIEIASPAAGIVIARNATTGQQAGSGTELFRIADLRKVWIQADAAGLEADALRPGVEADVIVPGRAAPVRARVTDVLPQFDASTQSLRVRLEADNAGYLLRPDMFVDVELRLPAAPATTVPHEALVQTGLETLVFVAVDGGGFEPRRVQPGRRFGDRVEITRGVEAGDRVAVAGTFLLDSERRMQINRPSAGGGR